MDFKVEILKYPTESDWMWCKTCTLNTVGKTSTKLPTNEWKEKYADGLSYLAQFNENYTGYIQATEKFAALLQAEQP